VLIVFEYKTNRIKTLIGNFLKDFDSKYQVIWAIIDSLHYQIKNHPAWNCFISWTPTDCAKWVDFMPEKRCNKKLGFISRLNSGILFLFLSPANEPWIWIARILSRMQLWKIYSISLSNLMSLLNQQCWSQFIWSSEYFTLYYENRLQYDKIYHIFVCWFVRMLAVEFHLFAFWCRKQKFHKEVKRCQDGNNSKNTNQ